MQPESKHVQLYWALWLTTVALCLGYGYISFSQRTHEAVPVFSGHRLALVHLFCSLPIAYLAVCRVRYRWSLHRFGFVLAALMTLLLPQILEVVSWILKQTEGGLLVRSFVRCVLGFGIAFTWIFCIPFPVAWKSKDAGLWTILIWLILPTVYSMKQSELYREDFKSSVDGMKMVQALSSLDRLVEIDGMKMLDGVEADDLRRKLKREVAKAEQSLARETTGPSLESTLQRAMQCMSLARFAEAQQVLLEAKSDATQVLLLLSITARELKDHRGVEVLSNKLLMAQPPIDTDSKQMAFQLLGEALVGQRKITEAIKVYKNAIQQCPEACSDFEMRLGNLLAEAGDVTGAMEHFEMAARADPRLSQEAKKRIQGLNNNSCRF